MNEIFAFDSQQCHPHDPFESYRRLYAGGTDVERTSAPFFAEVRGWRLERTLVYERAYGGVRHVRQNRASNDSFDHLVLHHVLDGELHSGPAGAPVPVGPGQTIVLDTREPMESGASDVRLVTVSLAREAAMAAAGHPLNLHGRLIDSRDGALLAALLQALPLQAPHLPAEAQSAVTRALVDLLSVAVSPYGSVARSDFYRLEYVRREAAQRVIDTRLGERTLSVADIVHETGMSRATLYRLFGEQGGVLHFIQHRRLQRLREWLDTRTMDTLSLAELAPRAGFADESHAGRLFKQAFGTSPGAYRLASLRATEAPSADMMARRWINSMDELD